MAPVTPYNEEDIAARPTPINPPTLKHNPKLRLHLDALAHPATTAFVKVIDTAHFLPDAINHILRHLYYPHGADNIPHVRSVTIVLREMGGVAYTTGIDLDDAHKEIHVALPYLSRYLPKDRPEDYRDDLPAPTTTTTSLTNFHREALGVLTHEAVHCYQHNLSGTAPGGLIEGIADYVRLKAGLAPPHWTKGHSHKTRGEKWDEGYAKTAWFLEWLEEDGDEKSVSKGKGRGKGAVSRLNARMGEKGRVYGDGKEFWEGLFGVGVEELWAEYVDSWKEKGDEGDENKEGEATKTCDAEAQGTPSATAAATTTKTTTTETTETTTKTTTTTTTTEELADTTSSPGRPSRAGSVPEIVELSLEEKREADGAGSGN
ncbi:uncharacterized protein AB675_7134 [Cyphellophora attinorum]|uniref:Uncharacterized protein n=1 Tax=Cyphellophora attinorum TaxID=1664694 RepID=A0A0N0NQ07_9EURO|nr:uncharacterized protein AB675_7134 [Phialophora attinorum]KPI43371.1 hypothetical protein AB675_7134 [Phialophora attinorum]